MPKDVKTLEEAIRDLEQGFQNSLASASWKADRDYAKKVFIADIKKLLLNEVEIEDLFYKTHTEKWNERHTPANGEEIAQVLHTAQANKLEGK